MKKSPARNERCIPAVLRQIRDRDDLRAARAGAAEARKKGAIPWRKVKRDLDP